MGGIEIKASTLLSTFEHSFCMWAVKVNLLSISSPKTDAATNCYIEYKRSKLHENKYRKALWGPWGLFEFEHFRGGPKKRGADKRGGVLIHQWNDKDKFNI